MFDYYKEKDFEEIFCYCLDTYAHIYQNGFSDIPVFNSELDENTLVCSFLNEALMLLDNSHMPLIFDISLKSLYYKFYNQALEKLDIEKLVLAEYIVKFMYFKDFLSFAKTSRIWSNAVKKYAVFKTCPLLPEEHKRECLKQILGEID